MPAAILAVIALIFFMTRPAKAPELPVVEEGPAPVENLSTGIEVEIADSPDEQARGLSGRTEIPHGYGMLFVFEEEGIYHFWMKDMLTSIDIIWLREDGTILAIEHDVSPSTFPRTFAPPEPVRYVLETAVGEAERQGWDLDSSISIH